MDNGMDALGDNLQPEELNDIEKGKRYGYPHLDPPGGLQKSELPKTNIPMALGYTAHAAPMQMSFYNASQFPAEYQGDAFVSMRGSWNRKPPSGYEVVRIEVHLLPSVDVHELGATIDPQSRRTTGVTTRLWLGKSCLARSIDSWQPAGKRPSASIETSRAWIRGGSATKVSKDPNVEPRNTTLGTERERAPHA
jgi:hypothetical protein